MKTPTPLEQAYASRIARMLLEQDDAAATIIRQHNRIVDLEDRISILEKKLADVLGS